MRQSHYDKVSDLTYKLRSKSPSEWTLLLLKVYPWSFLWGYLSVIFRIAWKEEKTPCFICKVCISFTGLTLCQWFSNLSEYQNHLEHSFIHRLLPVPPHHPQFLILEVWSGCILPCGPYFENHCYKHFPVTPTPLPLWGYFVKQNLVSV